MLIAEIHGKRFPEAEGQEDWLTSAVFGHLRHIPPEVFWADLFDRAIAVGADHESLHSRIKSAGISLNAYLKLEVFFWKSCGEYGEPDLIIRFEGGQQAPLIAIVQVKLNSGKSGTGNDDQLTKYLELLDDPTSLPVWSPSTGHRCLVYLTRAFPRLEIEESIRLAAEAGKDDAAERMFGLQWQDVLESAARNSYGHPLLEEVAEFLKVRGFEAFRGFRVSPHALEPVTGSFYGGPYFTPWVTAFYLNPGNGGRFYGH